MTVVTLSREESLYKANVQLRAEIANLQASLLVANERLKAVEDSEVSFDIARTLQMKAHRQSVALHRLNRRVRIQRLILRKLNELHPEQADAAFVAAKAEFDELDDLIDIVV